MRREDHHRKPDAKPSAIGSAWTLGRPALERLGAASVGGPLLARVVDV